MKTVLGVSLGSSKRDYTSTINIAGKKIELIRKGTDGDIKEAVKLFEKYDGKVDAFGLGGAVSYVSVNDKKYYFRQLKAINDAVKKSKFGDGNRVKGILSKNALDAVVEQGFLLKGMKALHMGAIDRYTQAKQLCENQCKVIFGDLIFGLGIPVPIRKISTINSISAITLPIITQMPFRWFYPIGKDQDKKPSTKFSRYFGDADIIVGDYIWMKTNLPDNLKGKIIVTNTTTEEDCYELKKRGLKLLVTTTPRLGTRSFGTNIIEGMLLALVNKPMHEINDKDLFDLIEQIPIKPNIERLN